MNAQLELGAAKACAWCASPAITRFQGSDCCKACAEGGPAYRVAQGMAQWRRDRDRRPA